MCEEIQPEGSLQKRLRLTFDVDNNVGKRIREDEEEYSACQCKVIRNENFNILASEILDEERSESSSAATSEDEIEEPLTLLGSLLKFDSPMAKIRHIVDIMGVPPYVAEIRMRDQKLGDSELLVLAGALAHCPSITVLDFSTNNIQEAGANALAAALVHCPALLNLNFGTPSAFLLHASFPFIITQIFQQAFNTIGEAGAIKISTALAKCTALTTLDLYGNNIGDVGAQAVAAALMHCPQVESIDLARNMIAGGAIALAASLSHCRALTSLNMESNLIDNSGAGTVTVSPFAPTSACAGVLVKFGYCVC